MRKETIVFFSLSMLLLLVTLGGYGFWFYMLQNARSEVRAAATSVDRIEREDAEIAAAEGALATLAADEQAVRAYFISPEDIVSFLEVLEDSGKEFGTTIEVVSVSPNNDGRITIALHIDGSFAGVMRTVGALEFGSHDIRASSLTIDTAGKDTWVAAAIFTFGALASSTPTTTPVTTP